jgi:hypothetical protein
MVNRRRPVDPIAARAFTLGTLQRIGEQRARLDEETRDVALAAYAAGGITWRQIGDALGVTASVAWHTAHPIEEPEVDTG